MVAVILAGGKGVRLWPESRRHRPKQLCKFVGNRSMLDHTIDRLVYTGCSKIIIITSDDLLDSINTLVENRQDKNLIEVLSEPLGKNTAPAVGLVLSRYYETDNDEVLGIFPADHHILDTKSFNKIIKKADQTALHGHIATIGISPSRPETGYGYIEKTRWEISAIEDVYKVSSFYEKPDYKTAQSYVSNGNFLWNAGIYVSKASTLLDEFEKYLPAIFKQLSRGYNNYIESYPQLPSISLDHGIAEKSNRIAVVPADFGWCDLGSWNALSELKPPDPGNNVRGGKDIVIIDSRNCVVKQADKTVVLFGVDDLLVVESEDIILVSNRRQCQDIRKLTDALMEIERHDLL